MVPSNRLLSPTCVHLRYDGVVKVIYTTTVTNNQKFVFHIPINHAPHIFTSLLVDDDRGNHPTVHWTRAPPDTGTFDGTVLYLLRQHIGYDVELSDRVTGEKLCGTLVGFNRREDPTAALSDDEDDARLRVAAKNPCEVFVRCSGEIIAHTFENGAHLVVHSKGNPNRCLEEIIPSVTGHVGTIPVYVFASGSGTGTLKISYCTGSYSKPLYQFQYVADLAPAEEVTPELVRTPVKCYVTILNPLPFALRNVEVHLVHDRLGKYMHMHQRISFNYPMSAYEGMLPAPGTDSACSAEQVRDLGRYADGDNAESDDDSEVSIATFSRSNQPRREVPPEYDIEISSAVSLRPNELCKTFLFSTTVGATFRRLLCLERSVVRLTLELQNLSNESLEPGTWLLDNRFHNPRCCATPLLRPGEEHISEIDLMDNVKVEKISASTRNLGKELLGMDNWMLETRVTHDQVIRFEIENRNKDAVGILWEARRSVIGECVVSESVRLYDGAGSDQKELTCAPLPETRNESKEWVVFNFEVGGHSRRAMLAELSYSKKLIYNLRNDCPVLLVAKLEDGGASPAVMTKLRALAKSGRDAAGARKLLMVLLNKLSDVGGIMEDVLLEYSDDEDGGAVDRYMTEVERLQTIEARVQQASDQAAEKTIALLKAFRLARDEFCVAVEESKLGQ